MNAQTLPASTVPADELTDLENFKNSLPTSSALRHTLSKMTRDLKSGADLVVAREDETLTPSQAAKLLGISRAHLYKVLDSGALSFHTVGERDRRIQHADLRAYSERLFAVRAAQAQSLAHRDQIEDELLDLMD